MKTKQKIKVIENHIANAANITVEELHSSTRVVRITDARAAVWYVLRQVLGLSYHEIGRHYNRHHTTVLRAVEHAENSKIAKVALMVIKKHDPGLLRKNKNAGPLSVDKWQY